MHIIKPQIDIGLVTNQPEAMNDFYGKLLNLKQGKSIPLGEGVIQDRFFIGRNTIKINHVPEVKEVRKGGIENLIGIRLLTLIFDDLELIKESFKKEKHKVPESIDFQGVNITFAKDPDGNLLELIDLKNSPAFEHSNSEKNDRIQIGLCVESANASKQFYGSILGFNEQAELDMGNGKTRFAFQGGDTLIKFWQADAGLENFSGLHFSKIGLRYFTYQIDDVEACYQYLLEQKIPIMQAPTDIDGVAKVLLVSDPDDNCVEFVEYY
jgi:catechol 2,3-dioxygenase-like lactoylglutathione lyase family enzyme